MTTSSRPRPSQPVQAPRTKNGPYQTDPADIRRPARGIEWRSARASHPVRAWLIGQLPIVRSIRAGTGRGGPRGRGRSEITPLGSYGWDCHVRDLLEIAELYGADSFDVIGHSMGGFIGMSLAAQHPRRCSRLVLIDAVGVPEPTALVSITKSISRLGRTYQSVPALLSYMQAAGTITPWDEFWDSYFAWELEPVDDTVRIRTDLAAVGEDGAYASKQDVYGLWPRLRCPVLLVRASRPMAQGGGLVVSQADAERFAAEARDATVVDVDADHYSILISPPAISAVERFVGAGAA
jgi:3-oxoadipate enol-lactonase